MVVGRSESSRSPWSLELASILVHPGGTEGDDGVVIGLMSVDVDSHVGALRVDVVGDVRGEGDRFHTTSVVWACIAFQVRKAVLSK